MRTLQVQKTKISVALEYFKHSIKYLKLGRTEKLSLVISAALLSNSFIGKTHNEYTSKAFSISAEKNNFLQKYDKPYVFILMYHKILPDSAKISHPSVEVTESEFKKQISFFKNNGYKTITLNELYNFISLGTPVPEKSFVITFDDGYYNNYKYLYPILKSYNMKAVIAVTTGNRPVDSKLRKDNMPFSWSEANQMKDFVEYTSHTNSHADLEKISKDQVSLRYELQESQREIENKLGNESDVIIYPYGHYNNKVIEEAKKEYKMGFVIENDLNYSGGDIMKIKRFTVKSGQSGEDILNRVMLHAGTDSAVRAVKDIIK